MGVELTFLIVDRESRDEWDAHTTIWIGKYREFFQAIEHSLKEHLVGVPVWCHFDCDDEGDNKYGQCTQTPYGSPLTYLTAAEILSLEDLVPDDGYYLKAALAYLKALEPDHKIILYWS